MTPPKSSTPKNEPDRTADKPPEGEPEGSGAVLAVEDTPPDTPPEVPVPDERDTGAPKPTDAQLTGGRGDDLEATVHEERTGTSDQDVRNRMMAENAVDLDALTAAGETAQGNRYGTAPNALVNFTKEALTRAEYHIREAFKAMDEAERWADVDEATSGVYAIDDDAKAEAKRQVEEARERFDEKITRLTERRDAQSGRYVA